MRFPRPRFTLRWLMVAVAVAAVTVWGWRMRRLSLFYRERAEAYLADQQFWDKAMRRSDSEIARLNSEISRWNSEIAEYRSRASQDRDDGYLQLASHFEFLVESNSRMLAHEIEDRQVRAGHRDADVLRVREYAHAARFPWLHVTPDPLEPE